MGKVIRPFCWHQIFCPWGLSAPALGLYTCIKSWNKLYTIRVQRDFFLNLQQMTKVTRCSCWHQNFIPKGVVSPCPGPIYMYKIMKKLYKIRLQRDFLKLVADDRSDKRFLLKSNFVSWSCLPLTCGSIHVLNHEKMCIKSEVEEILATDDHSDEAFLLT